MAQNETILIWKHDVLRTALAHTHTYTKSNSQAKWNELFEQTDISEKASDMGQHLRELLWRQQSVKWRPMRKQYWSDSAKIQTWEKQCFAEGKDKVFGMPSFTWDVCILFLCSLLTVWTRLDCEWCLPNKTVSVIRSSWKKLGELKYWRKIIFLFNIIK